MTIGKLIAITVIYGCTCVAWMILGTTNTLRTEEATASLRKEVASLFGDTLKINAPMCYLKTAKTRTEEVNGKTVVKEYTELKQYEISSSQIDIKVFLDQRQKGNLWFPTFKVRFNGTYTFAIVDFDAAKKYYLLTTLESADSIYSNIDVRINGKKHDDILPLVKKWDIEVVPDEKGKVTLAVSYDCTGMEQLTYFISPSNTDIARISDMTLKITTDFDSIDFPSKMMSPIEKIKTLAGYELTWRLKESVTGKDIGIIIPNKLNPGQIVSRVTFFAPVSLLFFFVVILVISVILKINLHPMHYFFLAATFFSFHLMYAYFSDHLNIYLTFVIAAVVSIVLTVTYLRLLSPPRFAFMYAPLAQLIYLVVFSFSFFFKGMTGLIVTFCAVITLFILMQVTGKINWDSVFGKDSDGRRAG